jgi:hypothetical protein
MPRPQCVKNEWRYTSTLDASLRGFHRDNILLNLILCHYGVSIKQILNCQSPINFCTSVILKGGSSVVSIVTKLWAGWFRVRIQAGGNTYPVSKCQTSSEAHPASYLMIIQGKGQGNWLQHDVDHSVCLAVRLRGAILLLPPNWPSLHGQGQLYHYCHSCCQLCKKPDPKRFWFAPKILWLCPPPVINHCLLS